MKASVEWLKEYSDIDVDSIKLGDILTMTGSKVETIEQKGNDIKNVVVGKILEIKKHEDSDHLVITQIDLGNEKVQIVTGANNIKEGDIVPIAKDGSELPGGVKIKNETKFEIDESILDKQLSINKENILIFHTHTCESYTPTEEYYYEQTGNFRTTDMNYSVVRVGDELTNYLLGFGFKVNHDKTYHDYPAYTGSYSRSLESVKKDLQETSSDIIIDLHRDAIGSKSNYDPSVKIGDDVASQLMFVIGTNGGGLYHPNWQNNLRFAIKVQEIANEMYPGLFKPMIVRNSRYNQHLGKAAVIIEVGSTGNTLEQSLTSMKYLAKVFEKIKN